MEQKFDVILVDMSNLYYRSFATSSYLTAKIKDGEEIITGGTFTSLRTIKKLLREFLNEKGKLYCVYDSPVKTITDNRLIEFSNFRKEIDPEYKSNREPKDMAFYEGLNVLKSIMLNYGEEVYSIEIEGIEADDLVPAILKIEDTGSKSILMVSGDLDWARDISDTISWQNHQKDILTRDLFYKKYNFYPEKLLLYKCFRGDGSDDIPKAVKGIRESILIQILAKYSSIKEVLREIPNEEFLSNLWKERILNNSSRLKLNEQLIQPIPISTSICESYIVKSKFFPSKLRMLYKSMGFKISNTDPRLLSVFPEEKATAKNFFKQEKLPRT